jgi:hypothetical protein
VQIDGSGWRLGTEPFLAYAASSAFRSLMNRYQAFVSLPSATHRAARCIGHSGKDLLFQTLARRLCNVRDLVCQPSYRLAGSAWVSPWASASCKAPPARSQLA